MSDFAKWVRYMLPGSVVALQYLTTMLIIYPNYTINIITSKEMGVGSLAISFLGTGALGFVFSTLYYTARNWKWTGLFNDHKEVLKYLSEEEKKFRVCYPGEVRSHNNIDSLCIRQRWELFNMIWHSEKHNSNAMKSLEPVAEGMHHIAHGLGAAFVGSIISFLIGLCWYFGVIPKLCSLISGTELNGSIDLSCPCMVSCLLVWVVPIICFMRAYQKVNRSIGKLYDDSLRLYFEDYIYQNHNRRYFYNPK